MRLVIYLSILVALTVANEENGEDIFKSANQQFTAKMFSEVANLNSGKSVVLSAFSVMSPLAQLAVVSEGPSHDEILKTIGFPNDNVTKEVFTSVNRNLLSVKGVELLTANRIYVGETAKLNDDIVPVLRDIFSSDFKNVNFAKSSEAAAEINTWVEDHTKHLIKDLIKSDSLSAATAAVLVNAIYFKGTWKHSFRKEATQDRDFHISKDKTVQVPTMYISKNFRYGESAELGAKLLELPYEGGESSLLVILPNEIDGLAALQEKLLNKDILDNALKNMFTNEVEVQLPKFKIETTFDLKKVLQNMGITKLFTPEAHLTKLFKGSQDVYVSDAVQKAYIEISETGTEAAAANEFKIVFTSSLMKFPQSKFTADRPFYFAITVQGKVVFDGHFTK